jgi:hypothetical protein
VIGVLGGLVVGKKTFRIVVKTATCGIIPNTRKKTRHSFVFLNSHGLEISEITPVRGSPPWREQLLIL